MAIALEPVVREILSGSCFFSFFNGQWEVMILPSGHNDYNSLLLNMSIDAVSCLNKDGDVPSIAV